VVRGVHPYGARLKCHWLVEVSTAGPATWAGGPIIDATTRESAAADPSSFAAASDSLNWRPSAHVKRGADTTVRIRRLRTAQGRVLRSRLGRLSRTSFSSVR
jgi:hypothetical protein